jgi:WD40 repeat protein
MRFLAVTLRVCLVAFAVAHPADVTAEEQPSKAELDDRLSIGDVFNEANRTICVGIMIGGSNVFLQNGNMRKKLPVEYRIANCGFNDRMSKLISDKGCREGYACQVTVDLNKRTGYIAKLCDAFSCSDTRIDHGHLYCSETYRPLKEFRGPAQGDWSVAFSPDGRYLLSGSEDNSLKLWDAATGRLLRALQGHSKSVTSVAFSPDGRYLLSGSEDNSLKLWDAATGRLLRALQGHSKSVTSVAFSPDGRYLLSGSEDNSLKLWDETTGRILRTVEGDIEDVTNVSFSPTGRYVLSGSGTSITPNVLKLWDIATGRLLRPFNGFYAKFSPDGSRLISHTSSKTGGLEGAELSDVNTGSLLKHFDSLPTNTLRSIVSNDSKTVLSGDGAKALALYDADTGRTLTSFQYIPYDGMSYALSPNGALVAAVGTKVRSWGARTGRLIYISEEPIEEGGAIDFSPDGRLLVVGTGLGSFALLDSATGRTIRRFHENGQFIWGVAFLQNGSRLLTQGHVGSYNLWDLDTGRLLKTFSPADPG